MKLRTWKQQTGFKFSQYIKCGAILLLIALSVLIVACSGTTNTNTLAAGTVPSPSATIKLGGGSGSPTPTLPQLWCGAWATQTTPAYNNGKTMVAINAEFKKNVDGNPNGIDQATATATILWGSGVTDTQTTVTTKDGLAVFFFSDAGKNFAINTNVLVNVVFSKPDVGTCTVDRDRAAYFTLINPSPTACTKKKHHNNNNNNNTPTPTSCNNNNNNGG